jgi:hypothetical protein
MPSRGSSIETTTSWDGDPRPEEKRETIDIIKAKVSDRLRLLSAQRLREQPQLQWHTWVLITSVNTLTAKHGGRVGML